MRVGNPMTGLKRHAGARAALRAMVKDLPVTRVARPLRFLIVRVMSVQPPKAPDLAQPEARDGIMSMTAFAVRSGSHGPHRWTAELRSVNGKGLDLRVRAPDWIVGLEAKARAIVAPHVGRGNVSLHIKLTREEGTTAATTALNPAQLDAVLTALDEIEAQAMVRGISLAPSTATDIAGLRGVLDQNAGTLDTPESLAALGQAIQDDLGPLVEAFCDMRASEGRALAAVLRDHVDEIEALTLTATQEAEVRQAEMAEALHRNLARVIDNTDNMAPERVAQELALIAVKADITEELDRLTAHVAAARDLIGAGGPIGRKLDFLTQEFNREANTLCAKAQNKALTATGLALKAVIDQLREQVQNVE